MKFRISLIVLTALMVAGCAQKYAPKMFVPENVVVAQKPVTASALSKVNVTAASNGIDQRVTPESFKVALIQTIDRAHIFGVDDANGVKIDAHIVKATIPSSGWTMEVDFNVHYKITRNDGKVLFDKDINAQGKAEAGEGFVSATSAVNRSLKAFKRAKQAHFDRLLAEIVKVVSE